MISIFSQESAYTVYCPSCWFSDKWDPLSYGRDFDFQKPFFPQFQELFKKVPLNSLPAANCENSEYVNYAVNDKNCYMIFCGDYNEDCLYSNSIFHCKDVVDSYFSNNCELSYELIDCRNCYKSLFLQNCSSCSDCIGCYACKNCSDCIGCVNLRSKKYHIFNKPYTPEEYQKEKEKFILKRNMVELFRKKCDDTRLQ
ncbi:MAG: hypothetical protein Q8P95_04445, partial [bacterium]|nr:hypothetical protein [bacterium]